MNLPDFIGLDIGFSSIKLTQVKFEGNKPILKALGSIPINVPINQIKNDNEKNSFSSKIKELLQSLNIKTNKCVVALPESMVFSKIIAVPDLAEEQLEKIIYFEAKNHLPLPVEDVNLDHIYINTKTVENKKIQQVLMIAAPKKVINNYLNILSFSGLEVLALETESVAISRLISYKKDLPQSLLVLDFGSKSSSVAILKDKNIIYSQSIITGSDSLTQAISRDYNIDVKQAEQYKKTYGLIESELQGKIYKSVLPVMQIISNEVNKIINFIKINLPDFSPSSVLLIGEGSQLPGLEKFMSLNLGLQSKIVDPLSLLEISKDLKDMKMGLSNSAFAVSLGLSLKVE